MSIGPVAAGGAPAAPAPAVAPPAGGSAAVLVWARLSVAELNVYATITAAMEKMELDLCLFLKSNLTTDNDVKLL